MATPVSTGAADGAVEPTTVHPRRVLVAGASGYIGKHVARELAIVHP